MKLSTVARLFAIVLGIISVTIVVFRSSNIEFNEAIVSFCNELDYLIGGIFDPIKHYVIDIAASRLFHLDIHLQPHWKYFFILESLLLTSLMHAMARTRELDSGGSATLRILAIVCALFASIVAGTLPLSNTSIGYYMAGATFACIYGAIFIVEAINAKTLSSRIFNSFLLLVISEIFYLLVRYVPSIPKGDTSISGSTLLGPLSALTITAISALIMGLARPKDPTMSFGERLEGPAARFGIDVLSVLGGAAAITFVARALA